MINKISALQPTYSQQKCKPNKKEVSFGMSIALDYKHMNGGSIKSIFKTVRTFLKARKRINAETKGVEITIGKANKSEIYLLGIPEKYNETKYNLAMSDFDNKDSTKDYFKYIKIKELTPEVLYNNAIEVFKATKSRFFV